MRGSAEPVRAYYHRILPFYERELAGRGDGPFWSAAAEEPPGCRVLEIGCGTGRATAFLARTAGAVTAFDVAPELLAVARSRLAGLANARLFAADVRHLRLRAAFDLVAAVDDPFVHLIADADRDRALRAAARHLAPDGRFVLDAAWLSPRRRRAAASRAGLVIAHRGAGGLAVEEVLRCEPGSRVCAVRFTYEAPGAPPVAASFRGRLWSLAELQRRARAAGLTVTNLWGDYDRSPWHRATSPRLIAELRTLN
ncbi:MAG TPA: class I SAM-dependent methyltransferase [Thermoanaerobaculia bacterium]|nr:class I SAM-dependent methyltransferase [Thermoanaerobaculia bacterium]